MGTGIDPTVAHIPVTIIKVSSARQMNRKTLSIRTTKVTVKASQAESSSADARMPLLDKAV
jgi:hypothetical protein